MNVCTESGKVYIGNSENDTQQLYEFNFNVVTYNASALYIPVYIVPYIVGNVTVSQQCGWIFFLYGTYFNLLSNVLKLQTCVGSQVRPICDRFFSVISIHIVFPKKISLRIMGV